MEGYEVITSDDKKAGHVVEVKGKNLIIENGLLLKKQHAIPKVLAHADDSENVVRLSVSSELVDASPKLDDGWPDDPAWSAEQEELRTGVEPAAQRRARIREGQSDPGPHGRPPSIPPDPHRVPRRSDRNAAFASLVGAA